jgi:glutaredoxin 2
MTLGYLELPYQSIVLPYNDEKTPLTLTGTKMLPIMVIDDEAMNESLQIMARIDQENVLKLSSLTENNHYSSFNEILTKLGTNVHNLAMPYWIWTPEFDSTSRNYFQQKKEVKRGPFKELVQKNQEYLKPLQNDLSVLTNDLKPFYRSDKFNVYDILLASHLWGLYVVPEFQFSEAIHNYLQRVKDICHFNYHQDFWS